MPSLSELKGPKGEPETACFGLKWLQNGKNTVLIVTLVCHIVHHRVGNQCFNMKSLWWTTACGGIWILRGPRTTVTLSTAGRWNIRNEKYTTVPNLNSVEQSTVPRRSSRVQGEWRTTYHQLKLVVLWYFLFLCVHVCDSFEVIFFACVCCNLIYRMLLKQFFP